VELGRLDVCLRVGNVRVSRAFYADLGFERVEGLDEEGWAVVVNNATRIGLFEARFMKTETSLNFRGGDVGAIVSRLQELGHAFESAKTKPDGSGSAELLDPDGHMIFFDTAPGESKK
jgi:catechol 2,3-dioxygenase-like lactoylglutathione lyase family enzyme